MKLAKTLLYFGLPALFLISSCTKTEELYLSEIEALKTSYDAAIFEKTVSKKWEGNEYKNGTRGGIWNDTILSDPKTFNQVLGDLDGSSAGIISQTLSSLLAYDAYNKKWIPQLASYEIETDEKAQTLTMHFTIRDNAVWSYANSSEKIPVTSDDFVFWYNEIDGDPESGTSGYNSQWMLMPDGKERHIDMVKVDDCHFDVLFPRIVAEPELATNMQPCPSFIFKPAKEKGGIDAVKNLFGINCNPTTIPSCGKFHITEYIPSRRLVFTRNPDYWDKDENGVSFPYYDKMICQIVGDLNTDYLLFKQGLTEAYNPNAEQITEMAENQGDDYTIFNAEGNMGAAFWTFNQNPKNKDAPYYDWFVKKEFRQAMSCLLNRDRIVNQTYRGLAEPKYSFFAESNPYYNKDIQLKYRFNIQRAEKLLRAAGFEKKDGLYYDWKGNPLEFDLSIQTGSTTVSDISQIICDECKQIGIKINVRQLDFQKLVESATATYDWQSLIIGLGSNLFPTQGSNVWPSDGNLHLWYPFQETPATDWEARIDSLYNEGKFTNDYAKAKEIWDEYQEIILEECPVIYLMRVKSFLAVRNKWDFTNVYYDNLNGADLERVYIRQAE